MGPDVDSVSWNMYNADGHPHAVKQKKPNDLGVYDMLGNVAEWTRSGSDPFFILAGGSFEDDMSQFNPDIREFGYLTYKGKSVGLRLVSYPADVMK